MEIGTAFGGVPAPDPLAQFLGRVLAWAAPGEPETYVNIHAFTPKAALEGRRFPRKGGGRVYTSLVDLGQIEQFLFQLNRDGDEVFFCISTRSGYKTDKQGNRKATRDRAINRPVRLKAFVLDLDVKAKGYPSQRAALAAVLPFFDHMGVKPTIVDTGVGLHAYISLTEGIIPAVWQPLALALVEAARQAGLKFDVAVTKDVSRILRLPTSFNRKDPDNPKPCRMLALGEDVPLAHLEQFLAPYRGTTPAAPRANGHAPKVDLSTLPGWQARPPITSGPDFARVSAERQRLMVVTSIDLLIGGCEVVKDSQWRGGNGDPEPLWFELAKLCHYVENGRDFFHDLSSDDPRYEEDQTDAKFDQVQTDGWPHCSTIAASCEAAERICRTCPMYGKGQTPIHAAMRGDPPGEAPSGQVNGHVNGHTLSASSFVTDLAGPSGTPIWVPMPKWNYANRTPVLAETGEPAFLNPVIDMRPRYDSSDGTHTFSVEMVILRGTNDPDDTSTFSIDGGVIPSRTKLAEALAKYNCILNPSLKENFMYDVLTQMRMQKLAVTRERTGWTKDGSEFAFGGNIYTATGPRPGATPIDNYLVPAGNLDKWKEAANKLVGKGLVEIELTMATGYTGPLVALTSVSGVFFYVWSGGTGRGKTFACACACSVACDPQALITSATAKGGLKRIVRFNNIPVYFDELAPDNAEHARGMAQIIKNTVSGSDTTRLMRQGDREQETLHSKNQVVGNGNRPITEIAKVAETNAQAARVIEIEMPERLSTAGIYPEDMDVLKTALEQNYGVAMEVYIDYVVRHREQVQEAIRMTTKALREHLKAGHDARFWLAQMAVIIVGAKIARMLGLQQFDVSGIQKFLIDWYKRQHREVFIDANTDDVEVHIQRLRDFYNDNLRARLVTKYLPQRGRASAEILNRDLPTSPDELAIRLAVEDKAMFVSTKKFRDWCDRREQRGASFEHSKSVLLKSGVCSYHRKSKSIGGSTSYYTAQEPVLEFNLKDPRLAGFIEEV